MPEGSGTAPSSRDYATPVATGDGIILPAAAREQEGSLTPILAALLDDQTHLVPGLNEWLDLNAFLPS
jgi:hypothetical protein